VPGETCAVAVDAVSGLRVAISVAASIPAAWLILLLVERVPGAHALWRPAPQIPFPRGFSVLDAFVYPLTVVVYALTALRFEDIGYLVVHLGAFTVLVALAVIDLETLRLPDLLVLPTTGLLLVAVIATAVFGDGVNLSGALAGAGLYFGFLLAAHLVNPAGMGFGDVKLALLMGLLLGWPASSAIDSVAISLWAMLVGFFSGVVVGLVIMVIRGRSAAYPFGPFLVLGTIVVILAAPDLVPAGTDLSF
jgi:leader peptidase (prepilin peptidase) / N-methyltransferase